MKLGPRFIGDPMKAKTGKKTTDKNRGYGQPIPVQPPKNAPKRKSAPRKSPRV